MERKDFFCITKGKRIISFVLTLVMCCSLLVFPADFALADTESSVWNGSSDTSWYTSGKTEFTLNTAAELSGLAKLVNAGNSFNGITVTLGKDIILNDETTDNDWIPIGGTSAPFCGVFDGAGHMVSGINVNFSARGAGFFGYVSGSAQIKNLTVGGSIVSSEISAGGLIGVIDNASDVVVKNCVNECSVVSGGTHTGGIVGYNRNGTIEKCLNKGAVMFNGKSGNGGISGIVGTLLGGSIEECANFADLKIDSSANTGNRLGGIIGSGFCDYNKGITVKNCYNRGSLNSNDNDTYAGVGGIVGYLGVGANTYSKVSVSDCYSTGTLIGTGNRTGGIAGIAETDEETGSIVSGITITNNYYLEDTVNGENGGIAGTDVSGSAYNRSADNLKSLLLSDAYAVDTDNINNGYPVFSWQAASDPAAESLIIASAPNKVKYTEGEFFDPTGMVVEFVVGEQHTAVTDYTLTPSADTALTTDVTAVEISYNGLKAIQPITVSAKAEDGAWDGTSVDTAWYDNNASADSFEISTPAELAGLAKLVTDGTQIFTGKTVTLTTDLNLGGYEWVGIGENSPYSSSKKSFAGTFDGNYHIIGNFTMQGKSVGLFKGLKSGGTVKNLGIDRAELTVDNSTIYYGGAVVANMLGSSSAGALVENCRTTPNVKVTAENTSAALGGIVGQTSGWKDTVQGCVNNGFVMGGRYAGGILGKQNATVINCYNAGVVKCGNGTTCYAGGILGYTISKNTAITNCYNAGDVIHPLASQSKVGAAGIACGSGGSSVFTNCYYLQNSASGLYNGKETEGIISQTAEELQALGDSLNDEQTVDYQDTQVKVWTNTAGLNSGYPVLYWQKDVPKSVFAVESIEIQTPPAKTTYGEGEAFDSQGMAVAVKYSGGLEILVPCYVISPSEGTPLTSADTKIAVSFGGKTVYQPISVLMAKAIKITSAPDKTDYIIQDQFKTAGLKVSLVYSDGSEAEITNYTVTPKNGDILTKENTKFTVAYGEFTAEQAINVKVPVSIAVTDAPQDAPNFVFYAGNKFYNTGMKLLLTYDDGSTEVITSGYKTNPDNYTVLTTDMNSVDVNYTKAGVTMTASHEMTVYPITGIAMAAPPNKTEYKEGETFDGTGLTAKITYADGTEKTVDKYSLTLPKQALSRDNTSVEIEYADAKFSVPITVEPAESMELTAPTKTAYRAGETLSTSGMKVTLHYADGTTKTIGSSVYKLTPSSTVALTEADTELTVSAFGFTQSVPITVEPAVEIEITKAPNKTAYKAGEKFQYTGMEVTVTYENGSPLKLTYSKVSYLPMSPSLQQPLTAKDTKITITLGEVTAEQPITVESSDRVELTSFDDYQAVPAGYQLLKFFPGDEASALYQYDGRDMLYSEKYGSFVMFVLSDITEEQALTKILPADGEAVKIEYNGDVNNDSKLRIDDAQLIYDLYSGWQTYRDDTAFVTVSALNRLEADINGDGVVDTQDALSAINLILHGSLGN